ncbi:MAG: winged helix-turn-helix domain-containing protein [Thaumarchaeota archaeon]|nr:winged helix-turn-helix domain-containing protein [Nitrososphaerota archaeon]
MAMQTPNTILEIQRRTVSQGLALSADFDLLMHQRKRHMVRSQNTIVKAILEACRTPTVQHWIMVKARLGYETFWKHMNSLITLGMMNTVNDGHRTLYSVNEKGLNLLKELDTN